MTNPITPALTHAAESLSQHYVAVLSCYFFYLMKYLRRSGVSTVCVLLTCGNSRSATNPALTPPFAADKVLRARSNIALPSSLLPTLLPTQRALHL